MHALQTRCVRKQKTKNKPRKQKTKTKQTKTKQTKQTKQNQTNQQTNNQTRAFAIGACAQSSGAVAAKSISPSRSRSRRRQGCRALKQRVMGSGRSVSPWTRHRIQEIENRTLAHWKFEFCKWTLGVGGGGQFMVHMISGKTLVSAKVRSIVRLPCWKPLLLQSMQHCRHSLYNSSRVSKLALLVLSDLMWAIKSLPHTSFPFSTRSLVRAKKTSQCGTEVQNDISYFVGYLNHQQENAHTHTHKNTHTHKPSWPVPHFVGTVPIAPRIDHLNNHTKANTQGKSAKRPPFGWIRRLVGGPPPLIKWCLKNVLRNTHTHIPKRNCAPSSHPAPPKNVPNLPKGTSNCVSNSTTPNGATMPCRHSTSCHWRALPKPVFKKNKKEKPKRRKKTPTSSHNHHSPALAVQLIRVGGTIFCRTLLFRWSGRSSHSHSKEKQKEASGATSDTMLHRNKWSPRSLRQARPGRGGVTGWGVKPLSQSVTDSVGEGAEKIDQRSELKSNRIEGALRKGQLGRRSEMASMRSLSTFWTNSRSVWGGEKKARQCLKVSAPTVLDISWPRPQ